MTTPVIMPRGAVMYIDCMDPSNHRRKSRASNAQTHPQMARINSLCLEASKMTRERVVLRSLFKNT